MKIPKIVVSLRALMLAILVVALLLSVVAYRRDQERRRAATEVQVRRQYDVTTAIRQEFEREVTSYADSLRKERGHFGGGSSAGSSSNGQGWEMNSLVAYVIEGERRVFVDIEVHSSTDGLATEPISIEDRGGELTSRLIEKLVVAYRENGWSHRVARGSPSPTATP